MKRLFRTSKSTVDPLPPPSAGVESNHADPYSPRGAQYYGGQADGAMQAGGRMMNGMDQSGGRIPGPGHMPNGNIHSQGHPPPPVSASEQGQGHGHAQPEPKGKSWFSYNNPSVTPFPIDLGGPVRRLSRKEKKDKVSSIPTMAEMNANAVRAAAPVDMQERYRENERMVPPPLAPVREGRSRGNSSAQPGVYPRQEGRPSKFYEGDGEVRPAPPPKSPSIDTRQNDPYRQSSPPLPVPSAPAMQGYTSGRSSPTSQNLYLPPGARPPTPPHAIRASTPTRPPFAPSSMGHSHTSVLSQAQDEGQEWERIGRDRGYSSASGSIRGSDVESSMSHAQHTRTSKSSHAHNLSSGKSPLATNTYAAGNEPMAAPGGALFPTPQPHPYALPPGAPSPYSPMSEDEPTLNGTQNINIPVNERPYEDHLDTEMRAMQIQDKERTHAQLLQGHHKDKDKDRKKFWGMDMGWAGKRDKEKERDRDDKANIGLISPKPQYAAPEGDRRGSDWSDGIGKGIQGMFSGQHRHRDQQDARFHGGHVHGGQQQQSGPAMLMEEEHRGRLAGRLHKETQDPTKAKDVAQAITLLCQNPDPSFAAVYSVCERIRLTENTDGVAKDAARALRKQFKHGNEAERRAATVVWLLMMRDLDKKTGFQAHASSKKFLANFEPLLFAHPDRPLVNQNTHRIMVDVLGDLTYNFAHEKGCEALAELWRKTGPPPADEGGRPLPDDHPIFHPEAAFPVHMDAMQGNRPAAYTYPADLYDTSNGHHGPGHGGPGYANLPSHTDDIRRLMDESVAAKESARVLAEALVYTRPEDLHGKPIIQEFYRKCFHAHESLTNQMGWAQAEATRSHERSNGVLSLDVQPAEDRATNKTIEEEALAALFEAHAALAEAIKQHDDLDRMAMEYRELSEVRERSKKDTRMGRDDPARLEALSTSAPQTNGFLAPANASSSRSPSPAAQPRVPASPRNDHLNLPRGYNHDDSRSRTPSPDSLLHPRIPPTGARPASPLGQNRVRTSRPLPVPGSNNPFRSQHASNGSLSSSAGMHAQPANNANPFSDPAKVAAGLTAQPGASEDEEDVPKKPSRKALGKRRAEPVDPDNDFDPHDLLMGDTPAKRQDSTASSEESVTADEVFFNKPVVYVYDAYQEKLDAEAREAAAVAATAGRSGGGSGVPKIGGGSGSVGM